MLAIPKKLSLLDMISMYIPDHQRWYPPLCKHQSSYFILPKPWLVSQTPCDTTSEYSLSVSLWHAIDPTHLPQMNHYNVRRSKSHATCTWWPRLIPDRPSTHTVHSQGSLTARLFIRFIRAVWVVIAHPGQWNTFASHGTTCKLFRAAYLLLWKQHYNIIQSYIH